MGNVEMPIQRNFISFSFMQTQKHWAVSVEPLFVVCVCVYPIFSNLSCIKWIFKVLQSNSLHSMAIPWHCKMWKCYLLQDGTAPKPNLRPTPLNCQSPCEARKLPRFLIDPAGQARSVFASKDFINGQSLFITLLSNNSFIFLLLDIIHHSVDQRKLY